MYVYIYIYLQCRQLTANNLVNPCKPNAVNNPQNHHFDICLWDFIGGIPTIQKTLASLLSLWREPPVPRQSVAEDTAEDSLDRLAKMPTSIEM